MTSVGFGIGTVLFVSVSAAIVSMISPNGEMKKYINLIATLAVLASIAVPIAATVKNIPRTFSEIAETDIVGVESPDFDIVSLSKKEIEDHVSSEVELKFKYPDGSVKTSVSLDAADTSKIEITLVSVGIPSSADIPIVREYVTSLFKGLVPVSVYEVRNEY